MRFKGRLKTWNDDRGFGFIEPIHGGEEIFVHITAFSPRVARPQAQQFLSFEIEIGPQGKKRAKNCELVPTLAFRKRSRRETPAPPGSATLFVIPGFVLLFIIVAPPLVLAAVYVAVSLVAYLAYAKDKLAAGRGDRRTPESTLHLLALAGGWPGALLAQQFLRHKSMKMEFRKVFWATVVLNVAGFAVLCSPAVQSMLIPR